MPHMLLSIEKGGGEIKGGGEDKKHSLDKGYETFTMIRTVDILLFIG